MFASSSHNAANVAVVYSHKSFRCACFYQSCCLYLACNYWFLRSFSGLTSFHLIIIWGLRSMFLCWSDGKNHVVVLALGPVCLNRYGFTGGIGTKDVGEQSCPGWLRSRGRKQYAVLGYHLLVKHVHSRIVRRKKRVNSWPLFTGLFDFTLLINKQRFSHQFFAGIWPSCSCILICMA